MLEREAFGNATVVARLQGFHWVWVDRDHTPELPKRFHVSAYPSLLVLGPNDENVHRWAGFLKVEPFLAQVDEAHARWKSFTSGEPWDVPNPRKETICSSVQVTTHPAPSEAAPAGIAFCRGKLWVAQGNKLHRCVPGSAADLEVELPESVRDLGSDGQRLFALTYGWTAGTPIHELDPETGKTIGSTVTEANKVNKAMGGSGVAFVAGDLWALESFGKLSCIDPKSGEVKRVIDTGVRYVAGLDWDGKHFVFGSRDALHFLAPDLGKVVKALPVNYPIRALACREDRIWIQEQPIFGFSRQHETIRVWPKTTVLHELVLTKAPATTTRPR